MSNEMKNPTTSGENKLKYPNNTESELLNRLSEQEKLIDSLKEIENKYEKLFNNSIDGIYKSTDDGKFIEVNASLVKMLGYDSREDLLNIDIKSELYFDVSERNQELSNLQRTFKKSDTYRLRKNDGTEIWVEDYGKNVYDINGKILYYEGILRDVSEKKKYDDVLDVLLKISKIGYASSNLKEFVQYIQLELSRIIDTSNFYIAFINKEKQTINIPFISGEESEEEFPAEKSMTAHLINTNKSIFLHADGLKKLLDQNVIKLIGSSAKVWLGVPLRVNDEAIGAIVVQSYDNENAFKESDIELLEFVASHISLAIQRKKIHQETLISKQILRKVLDNIPINVFWKDTASNFLGVNAISLKEMNLENESDIIGKSDFDFYDQIDAAKYKADEQAIMLSGKPKLNYQESHIKNGETRCYVSNKLPIFDEKNVVIGIVGTSEDISIRKQNQLELEKLTGELKVQNETKNKFFSIISHDLINPIAGIIGFSELLKENSENLKPEKIKSYATIINKSANFTLALLHDLLEWSRVQIGSIEANKENLILSDLLAHNIASVNPLVSSKNIALIADLPKNLGVFADKKMVSTITRNLMSNAIKFTPKGGTITISSKEIMVKNKKMIETTISDTGIGMSKEKMKNLFKIEHNYRSAGTDKEAGTGLGLVLCNEFIEKNNGTIKVISKENVGSSFIFTLEASS
ncbi:MAG: PAS domain S-box protein [Flavobacteriaceae bacterium]|nr:PAS domain S-box protein [Flavobacteriaceae bacterium]